MTEPGSAGLPSPNIFGIMHKPVIVERAKKQSCISRPPIRRSAASSPERPTPPSTTPIPSSRRSPTCPKPRLKIVALFGGHIFDRACKEHGIEHRLTKPYHPWTNSQAERMNRTIKDATSKAFHYPSLDALRTHVLAFVSAYNFAKHLKALRWRTPFQSICDAWQRDPLQFKIDPRHLIQGPNA